MQKAKKLSMTKDNERIFKDQIDFFNKNAALIKSDVVSPFFLEYVNKEQKAGFAWLADREYVLDYGCGTGTSIDAFLKHNLQGNYRFIGVDIADVAIQIVKKKYPIFTFYTINNNNIPELLNNSMDGAYLLHVLHHSADHEAIFLEIYNKLRQGGKLFLSDMSSNNPLIKISRNMFKFTPHFVKQRFADDLVVDGAIPDKYKVDPNTVVAQLKAVGFSVAEIGHGHLFVFFFSWVDRFIPFSRLAICRGLYSVLWAIEDLLLKCRFFQKRAEVFYIKCVK